MSGTQMFLVIGSLVLFSVLVINVNRTIMHSDDQKTSTELISSARAVGESVINLVSNKAFDEKTLNNPDYSLGVLTSADSLGADNSETLATFDDVDDYNNQLLRDSIRWSGISNYYTVFNSVVKVNYVSENNVNSVLNVKSRMKRILVSVYNDYMTDTLHLSYFKSY